VISSNSHTFAFECESPELLRPWTDLFAALKNITEIPGALDLNETFHLLAILQTSKISAADEGLRIHDARACPTPVNY
jgi:hypothetical protein